MVWMDPIAFTPTALPPRPVRPTAADSIASARERIPIELAFLGKRIFYSIKAIPRPPKPEDKTSFSKRSKDEEELPARDLLL